MTFSTKPYIVLANLLFITAGTYLGVAALYKYFTSRIDMEDPPVTVRAEAPRAPAEVNRALGNYAGIQKRNLFKTEDPEAQKEPAEPAPDVEAMKATELKLKLWGTVAGDEERAYAVIEESRKRKQNLYRVGDAVQGALVRQILREKVVLSVNGNDEILAMEKPVSRKAVAMAPNKSTPFPLPVSRQPSGGNISLEREAVEEAIENVNELMKMAKIRPHFKDGKPDGLTLSRIKRGSIFTDLGLRSGDIITGVDGQQIESVDDALKFYESLKSSDNVSLDIRRRGKEMKLDYNIQ